jgi:hypothetical protein
MSRGALVTETFSVLDNSEVAGAMGRLAVFVMQVDLRRRLLEVESRLRGSRTGYLIMYTEYFSGKGSRISDELRAGLEPDTGLQEPR